jgi:hypothetical protein
MEVTKMITIQVGRGVKIEHDPLAEITPVKMFQSDLIIDRNGQYHILEFWPDGRWEIYEVIGTKPVFWNARMSSSMIKSRDVNYLTDHAVEIISQFSNIHCGCDVSYKCIKCRSEEWFVEFNKIFKIL